MNWPSGYLYYFKPVLHRRIKDSFTFAKTIQKLAIEPDKAFIRSFNIANLFTNVPLAEAIQISADYLCTKSSKTNLSGTLVHRALIIYLPSELSHELNSIRSILNSNGYPDRVNDLGIEKKLRQVKLLPKEGPQKCLIYLKLPWIGNVSLKFEERCMSAISLCCGGVKPCAIFSTKKALPGIWKMLCLPFNKAWSYTNRCAAVTVGT